MKNGDAVFFKRAKTSSNRKAPEVEFKGYGFGVLLGHVPPFQKDPPPEHLMRLMGTIGFLSFDDVAAFLGDESGAACVKAFEDKYYGKVVPPAEGAAEPEAAAPPAQPSGLLDVSGAPMPSATPPPPDEL